MEIKPKKTERLRNIYYSYTSLSHFEKLQLRISYFLKLIVFVTIIISLIQLNFFLTAASVLMLVLSALPAVVEKQFRIIFPVEIDFAYTVFIFLHFILGEGANYYHRFWWYDLLLHTSSAILIGMVGFMFIYFFLYTQRIKANPIMAVVFSISFSIASEAIWEIIEFILDMTFGFNMQKSGLVDTMTDMIVGVLGACAVGIGVYRYLTKNEDGPVKILVNKFINFNIKRKQRKIARRQKLHTEDENKEKTISIP
jgi:hypothetical protein